MYAQAINRNIHMNNLNVQTNIVYEISYKIYSFDVEGTSVKWMRSRETNRANNETS